jgi:hypothetical protein
MCYSGNIPLTVQRRNELPSEPENNPADSEDATKVLMRQIAHAGHLLSARLAH